MNEARFSLEEFELYQAARKFRQEVYRLIRLLPKEERYSLDPQMRRAAISVTNNIAEGHGRFHYQEGIQFCRIARGSVSELIDDLNICVDESYGDAPLAARLKQDAYSLIARLNGYIAYLERKKPGSVPAQREPVPQRVTTHHAPTNHSPDPKTRTTP